MSGPHVILPRQLLAQRCTLLHWMMMNPWKRWSSGLGGSSPAFVSTPPNDLLANSEKYRHYVNQCPWRAWCTSLGHGHTSHNVTVTRCPSFPHECRRVKLKLYEGYSRLLNYCDQIKQDITGSTKSKEDGLSFEQANDFQTSLGVFVSTGTLEKNDYNILSVHSMMTYHRNENGLLFAVFLMLL